MASVVLTFTNEPIKSLKHAMVSSANATGTPTYLETPYEFPVPCHM